MSFLLARAQSTIYTIEVLDIRFSHACHSAAVERDIRHIRSPDKIATFWNQLQGRDQDDCQHPARFRNLSSRERSGGAAAFIRRDSPACTGTAHAMQCSGQQIWTLEPLSGGSLRGTLSSISRATVGH